MLIATRAGAFRGHTMRSVDDLDEYLIPVRKRGWTRYGYFRKRNMLRAAPLNAPKADTPEKHPEIIDLEYFQKVAPSGRTYQITLRPWSE